VRVAVDEGVNVVVGGRVAVGGGVRVGDGVFVGIVGVGDISIAWIGASGAIPEPAVAKIIPVIIKAATNMPIVNP
jgi:hypothetical protein